MLELQKTFYRPPRLPTAERWRRETPAEAEFTLKAWQLITHEPSSPTYRRVHCVDPLAARPLWGEPCYFRLHGLGGYRCRYTDEDLRSLRAKLPAGRQCYVMFNSSYMEEDARRFRALLGLPVA